MTTNPVLKSIDLHLRPICPANILKQMMAYPKVQSLSSQMPQSCERTNNKISCFRRRKRSSNFGYCREKTVSLSLCRAVTGKHCIKQSEQKAYLMWMQTVGVDARVKFGDSRSNRSWDMRAAHFVMNDERTTKDNRGSPLKWKTEAPLDVFA